MSKTIVVSDLHGDTALLEAILEHAEFSAENGDHLVVAGDLVDVGTDDTIGMAQSLGATILAGNHEVSAAIGLRINPQNAETREMAPELARLFASGEWPLALAVDGWLITHAGVSTSLSDLTVSGEDAEDIAQTLNTMFKDEISRAVRRMPLDFEELGRFRLLGGELGPLWFRPFNLTHIPSGLRQIVGHTPPESLSSADVSALESRGWLLIEPGGHTKERDSARIRYALIDEAGGRVIEA